MQTVGKVEFNKPAKLLQRAQELLTLMQRSGVAHLAGKCSETAALLNDIRDEIGHPQHNQYALDIHSVKINIGRVEPHNVD